MILKPSNAEARDLPEIYNPNGDIKIIKYKLRPSRNLFHLGKDYLWIKLEADKVPSALYIRGELGLIAGKDGYAKGTNRTMNVYGEKGEFSYSIISKAPKLRKKKQKPGSIDIKARDTRGETANFTKLVEILNKCLKED